MAIPSDERQTLSGLAGKNPQFRILVDLLSSKQQFRLEDGRELHYWGMRTDLHNASANTCVVFGVDPHPRFEGAEVAWRLLNQPCFLFLCEPKGARYQAEVLILNSASGEQVVLQDTGERDSFQV